jgi:hypothetical protein
MQKAVYDLHTARQEFAESLNGINVGYWQMLPDIKVFELGVRVLCKHNPYWAFNVANQGRVWNLTLGVCISLRAGWRDFQDLLEEDHPAHWIGADAVARHMAFNELIEVPDYKDCSTLYWLCQPVNCYEWRMETRGGRYRYMVKIGNPSRLFDDVPEPIEAGIKTETGKYIIRPPKIS